MPCFESIDQTDMDGVGFVSVGLCGEKFPKCFDDLAIGCVSDLF